MAASAQRIAELESQLEQARADFFASAGCLEAAFTAGVAHGRDIALGRPAAPRPPGLRHLRAVPEPEPELEAGI
jgi:hypothetical protein